MASMGRYCKAYPKDRLQAFPGWKEKDWKSAKVTRAAESSGPVERGHYYLQENYTVTADIYIDEQVVFDAVDAEWINFCTQVLEFKNGLGSEAQAVSRAEAAAQ